MPAQRNQRSTRPATPRAGGTTARCGNDGNGNSRRNHRAAYWPVELFIGTVVDLLVEGQNGDTFGIDSRTAR